MTNKCSTNPNIPRDIQELLNKVPAFRYMLPPVDDYEDLYKEFQVDKLERNNFAYSYKQNTFYIWREVPNKSDQYAWFPMSLEVGATFFPDFLQYVKDNIQDLVTDPVFREAIKDLLAESVQTELDTATVQKLDPRYIHKDRDDKTEYLIKFLAGAEFGDFISSLSNGKGAAIDSDGNAEFETLKVRGQMIIQDLVINRAEIHENEELKTEGAVVERVEPLSSNAYSVYFRKDYPNDMHPFHVHDVLFGSLNTLKDNVREASTWMRVTNVNRNTNSITAVLYDEVDTPKNTNSRPSKGQNIARWGNAFDKQRQRLWFTSSKDGREVLLMGVDKPILEFKNFAYFNGLPPMEFEEMAKLPLNEDQPYVYARGLIVQDIIRVNYKGLPMKTIEDLGPWVNGMQCFDGNTAPFIQNDVWHNGCRFRCVQTTTTEPSIFNTNYILLSGSTTLMMNLYSPQNFTYFWGDIYDTITAVVSVGQEDVTAQILPDDWSWKRETSDSGADSIWNEQNKHITNKFHLTQDDLKGVDFNHPVSFTCTAYYRQDEHLSETSYKLQILE